MNKESYIVNTENANERLDKYLCNIYPDLSRSFFQKLIKENNISVNDKLEKSNYKVKEKDIICVTFPDVEETTIEAENIPLDILYEDNDLLIVNKPKGMVVHPSAGHD